MRRIQQIILALLAAFLIVQAAYSLQWKIAHDEAPLLYESFLMHIEGRMPYRDLFDFQMPGSYAAYYIFGSLTSFIATRIRVLDLTILSFVLITTFLAMRGFGKPAAFAAAILFGLKYLQGGPSLALQREYLAVGILSFALFVGMRDSLTLKHRLSLGFLFGLAAIIKPHAALGLVPFLLFDIANTVKRRNLRLLPAAWTSLFPAGIGFAIPFIVTITWLALTHALTPFLNIAMNYWPLYSQVNGAMEINTGAARWSFILTQLPRLGGHALWLIPAAFAVYLNRNKQTYLLASLALCYAIYPAFSGQFFPYHYIPFIYFIILLSSTILAIDLSPLATSHSPLTTYHLPSFLFLIIAISQVLPSTAFIRQLQNKPISTSTDRADEIAVYLNKNLKPGDTIQPLDWTGGTLLAMLETRAHIATPYVFDFYFYHHVSTPYIQSLRADFMTQLQKADPRFIVEVTSIDKPWVSGADTSRDFPELRAYLDANYSITIQKEDYIIYERN